MIILGIETSCDDTCAAVVSKEKGKISSVSGESFSQIEIHKKWGGVYPSLAKREHQGKLVTVTEAALKKSNLLQEGKGCLCKKTSQILSHEPLLLKETNKFLSKYKKPEIDAIAVTIGPGLDPCLWVGVNFARVLSCAYNIPLIPVNHIKAHALSYLLEEKHVDFPAVVLIASGGHTELALMRSVTDFELLGETRDDAAGECFDKSARIIGLPYPGGPAIATEATQFSISNTQFSIKLPRPMINTNDYDFSFSGLKTAVLYNFRSQEEKTKKDKQYIIQMAKEVEEAITDVLVKKLKKAADDYNAKTVILGGGVTANKRLREKVNNNIIDKKIIIPSILLSTDNAEMIAAAGIVIGKNVNYEELKADPNLKIYEN